MRLAIALQAVPHGPDRLDRRRSVAHGELSTQITDIHVHDARIRVAGVAPYGLKQVLACDHLAGMPHEEGEQAEFGLGEPNRLSIAFHPPANEVDADVAHLETGRARLVAIPQVGANARGELLEGERLREVVG